MATTTRPIKGSSAAAYAEYLQDVDKTLGYYDDGQGFDRVWGGLSRELGIEQGMSKAQWEEAFVGQWNGERLVRRNDNRVPMMDVTLSAPKSVVELMIAGDDRLRDQVKEAMWAASKEAFDYAERTTLAARVRTKVLTNGTYESEQKRYAADLLATPVMQYCARPTKTTIERGAPPDPSLHVHIPIFTMCKVGEKYLTADNWGFKVNAEHIDSVFMGELARQLESIGIEVETNDFDRARNGKVRWEVAGSRNEARQHWSSNTERMWEIRREYEEERGKPIDDLELRRRMYLTRSRKTMNDKEQDSRPSWDLWREDAEANDVPLMRVNQKSRPVEHEPYAAAAKLRERLIGPQGWVRDDATFDERTIGQAIRRCAVGLGFSQRELAGLERIALNDETDVVRVRDAVDPDNRLYTTTAILEAEKRVATTRQDKNEHWVDITGRAGTGKSRLTKTAVEAIRSMASYEVEYNGEKVVLDPAPITQAVKAALSNQDVKLDDEQIDGVRAITKAAAGADNVIVVSMAASTAERTGQKVHADAWGSVESVISRIEKGSIRADSRTLLVIEEAGQLDTLRADKLLKAVGDARIVTLGDTRQLSAIGGAGWYADALARHGSIELTEVRRQKDQRDVDDYALVRDGRAGEALESLQGRGRVHTGADDSERLGRVFHDYRRHREAGRLARDVRIVLDSSNQEVDTANRFVQRDRLSRGEISPTSAVVESEDQGRRWALHENDQIIMLSSVRVRGEDPIKNGTSGVVRKLDLDRSRIRVRLEDDREVNLPLSASIGLSYAVHIQKFQGGETAVALVVPGRNTSRNAGYTSLTRGVDESHVYVSDEAGGVSALAERWATVDEKVSATTTIEQLRRQEQVMELPPLYSDELDLNDIALDPIPDLDPVRGFELSRDDDLDPFKPERLVEPSLEQDLNGPELEF